MFSGSLEIRFIRGVLRGFINVEIFWDTLLSRKFQCFFGVKLSIELGFRASEFEEVLEILPILVN